MHTFGVNSNESACRKVNVLDWNKSNVLLLILKYTFMNHYWGVVVVGKLMWKIVRLLIRLTTNNKNWEDQLNFSYTQKHT